MKDKIIIVLIVLVSVLFLLLLKMHHINNELMDANNKLLKYLR